MSKKLTKMSRFSWVEPVVTNWWSFWRVWREQPSDSRYQDQPRRVASTRVQQLLATIYIMQSTGDLRQSLDFLSRKEGYLFFVESFRKNKNFFNEENSNFFDFLAKNFTKISQKLLTNFWVNNFWQRLLKTEQLQIRAQQKKDHLRL